MKALIEGDRSSSDLNRATGLEGGQLYHHLKEPALAEHIKEPIKPVKVKLCPECEMQFQMWKALASEMVSAYPQYPIMFYAANILLSGVESRS